MSLIASRKMLYSAAGAAGTCASRTKAHRMEDLDQDRAAQRRVDELQKSAQHALVDDAQPRHVSHAQSTQRCHRVQFGVGNRLYPLLDVANVGQQLCAI